MKPLRALTYSRCSTLDKGQNPQIQIEEMRRYCSARGWEIQEEIIDEGYSGGNNQRPGLRRLIALALSRKIDVIVVLKLDRLFRSLKELVTLIEEWDFLGIKFVAVADQLDWTTPAGKLVGQVLGSLAEFERALIKQRTQLGLEHARRSGKRLGRPRQVNYEQIRELRRQGNSFQQIQKHLGVSKGAVCRALRGSTPESSSDPNSKPEQKQGVKS